MHFLSAEPPPREGPRSKSLQVHSFTSQDILFMAWNLLAKERAANDVKIPLDVAKGSANWFPPLKSTLGGVNAIIKHHGVFNDQVGGRLTKLTRLPAEI